ncbi:MAG: host attachment protein [Armatimonadetes bacterium]|nr:host attachment protein [Armatimonadota bacterium]CUU35018.1 peptide chain release factor subunit 1 [Armatimonadetes bacterium GXS]
MQNTLKTVRDFRSDKFFVTSLYLSLTPQERATRPPMYQTRLKTLQNQLRHWLDDHPMDPDARESVEQDFKRMMDFIDEPKNLLGENSLPVRGIALFSCSAEGLFEAVRLPYVERNTLVVDKTPYIRRLFAVEADFGVNLVAVFDHRDAHFYQVDIHGIRELESFRFSRDREVLPPGVHGVRTPAGMRALHGMGERNVQMLKQHEQQQHLRHIADTLLQLRRTHPFDRLLIAAPDDLASAFPTYLHDYVRRTFAGTIAAHDKMPVNQLYERVLDKILELDREQEKRLLQEFNESIPHLAMSGIDPVLKALEWGNVRVLLYDTDYSVPGCVYYPSGLLGLYPEHAPEGTEMIWMLPDIVDTVVERALEQGAQIEAVHAPEAKAEIHGVSAILRYPMSVGESAE